MFAEVAVNAPLRAGDRTFTFAVPHSLEPQITIGTPVRVPFGRQTATGFVVGLSAASNRAVRPIAAVDERLPVLPVELVDLAAWMAEQYVCSVGEALWSMIPSVSAARRKPRLADASGGEEVASPPRPGEPGEIERLLSHVPAVRLAIIGDDERFGGYLEALRWLEAGQRGAIFLVPEVVQAQALLGWVNRHSSLPALITHGELTDAERWTAWRQIQRGAVRIVVGTRLAVFAPVRSLSLIVIDHEEDASYKEERAPRYHARRVAEERARRAGAAVVWGTPAPSVEVMHSVIEGGAASIIRSPERRAAVAISDVRAEVGPVGGLFGRRLFQLLARTLPRGRAIVFVPRRGYADFLLCHECGWVPRCPQCGVAMTYHVRQVRLQCHLCGRNDPAPEICRTCGGTHLRPHGLGTERVEHTARRLFRGTTIYRLDAEVAPDLSAQQRVWQQFGRKGGLLIGTQLLVKGVGQVPAAVVGVIGIDAGLNLPDFRAAERAYQVLTRLVALAEQEMIVQTFAPSHPALRALVQQDADKFYRDELDARKQFRYPPYCTLLNLIVAGPDPDTGQELAARLAGALGEGTEVLGPSPAPLARVRGRYRWQVLVKEIEELAARRALSNLLRTLAVPRDTKVLVDVDPVDLL